MLQLFKAGGLSKGIQPDLVKQCTKSGHTVNNAEQEYVMILVITTASEVLPPTSWE